MMMEFMNEMLRDEKNSFMMIDRSFHILSSD